MTALALAIDPYAEDGTTWFKKDEHSLAPRLAESRPVQLVPDLEPEAPGDWRERALCAQTDPELFFPEKGVNPAEARAVCLACDVRRNCLADGLENRERFGIWGGLTPRQFPAARRYLRHRAARAAAGRPLHTRTRPAHERTRQSA